MDQPSGRQPGRISSRGPTPSSGSRRGTVTGQYRRSQTGVPKELIICLGVLAVLLVVCGVLYATKSRERQRIEVKNRREREIQERNEDLAYQYFLKAQSVGTGFVTGKTPDAAPAALFAPFTGDNRVHNVIYRRDYRDRKNAPKTDQRAMYNDRLSFTKIASRAATREQGTVQINNGVVGDEPIMIAGKHYEPEQGDRVNAGGDVTVIVKAGKD